MSILRTAIVLTVLVLANLAEAAEFRRENGHISISGKIEKGDLARFRAFLKNAAIRLDLFRGGVALDSPGGDVSAAIGIAKILHLAHASVWVHNGAVCYSSCFVLFAAGSYRLVGPGGSLGVHRLSFSKEATIRETEQMLAEVGGSIEAYLRAAGMPEQILQKARDTPPGELFKFDGRWLTSGNLRLDYRPAFIDVVTKTCGDEPLASGKDFGQSAWLVCMDQVRWKEQKDNWFRILEEIAKPG